MNQTVCSQADIEEACKAGVLAPDAAERLQSFIRNRPASPAVADVSNIGDISDVADEEPFRILFGFNDIFVSTAVVLIVGALCALGWGVIPVSATIAVVSWALAEYFTRQRRMVLPSILLSQGFVWSVLVLVVFAVAAFAKVNLHFGSDDFPSPDAVFFNQVSWLLLAGGVVGALAAYAHWRRFRVPIDVATGISAILVPVVFRVLIWRPMSGASLILVQVVFFICGLLVFALALKWDASDRERVTRRTDVAFWLHRVAAPLIVFPVFALVEAGGKNASGLGGLEGLLSGLSISPGAAIAAIAVYVVLIIIALAVNRRVLLVAALLNIAFAINALLASAGLAAEEKMVTRFALTALIIGVLWLLLAIFWKPKRRLILRCLPARVRTWLPQA